MSLIESISRGAFGLRADVSGTPAPWDDYWYNPIGAGSASGMRVTAESAKRLAIVIACVGAKARQLAMLPCKIYTDLAGGGKRVVANHPIYDVLYQRPNSQQTAFEFKQMMEGHVELRGNAYAEIVPGPRGPVDQLVPMHPDRVQVEVLRGSGRLRYIYNDPLTNQTRTLVQEEVFHLRDFCDNAAVGQSRISMACDVFGVALAQQDYAARFLKNDATPNLVVTGTNFETKQDEELYRQKFQETGTGENRGKIRLLPPGVDIKTLSVTPVDAQLLEAAKMSDVRICAIFNTLPHLVGVDTGKAATYASVEQFNIMNAVQSVLPMVIMWEQAIQRDLILSDRYYAKFSMAALLRGDFATRVAGYTAALGAGWMSQDDVRELEDWNPIPNGEGKTYWRPLNWAPLRQLTNPQPAQKTQPGNPDDQSQETGSGGDPAGQAAAHERLKLLAVSAADRCVRREVSGVRKLIEREAGSYEVTEFYAEQERFIVGVFHMEAIAALNVKIACDARAQQLTAMLAEEDAAGAQLWIERVAVTEPIKLATLAVEGVQ